MRNSELHAAVRRMVTPLATPLLDFDRLDCGGLERLIEHVIGGGVTGIFVLGTTGESASLSYRLRTEVIQHACTNVAGRVPVLVGISDTSYVESTKLADVARNAGADAVVVAPPYYFVYSQDDLLRYIESITAAAQLPVFLYNIPSLTKVWFASDTVRRAADVPGIAGVKDSSFDLDYLRRVVSSVSHRDDFSILIGPEGLLLEGLRIGAHGGVCGGSNLNPELLVGVVEAFRQGDVALAEELQRKVVQLNDELYSVGDAETGYVRGLKCALNWMGIGNGLCAPPFSAFTDEEREEVRRRMVRFSKGEGGPLYALFGQFGSSRPDRNESGD